LGHGIALELVCEYVCGHLVLLASKITKQGIYKSTGYSGTNLRRRGAPSMTCTRW
jgi:hypothetical protein